MATPPGGHSEFDSFIIERIIKALELVTEMGSKLALLEQKAVRHEKLLEGNGDSLPTQVRLLREAVDDLEKVWAERQSEAGKQHWNLRLAAYTAAMALAVNVTVMLLSKWLGK